MVVVSCKMKQERERKKISDKRYYVAHFAVSLENGKWLTNVDSEPTYKFKVYSH